MTSAAPPMPPCGGPLEIVFSFDTTGSMSSCLTEVRNKLKETIERLFADIPALRIAVFAHGDYCDAANYITKFVDFTNDVKHLQDFVQSVGPTSGGDGDECYELVLKEVREKLSWTAGTQRCLVMIGDANPHPADYHMAKEKIYWEDEVRRLKTEMGVRIYGVQAHASSFAKDFWKALATMTGGKHMNLSAFPTIVDMMMAICYREHGAELFHAYEAEVREREGAGMRHELTRMFDTLRSDVDDDSTTTTTLTTASRKRKGAKVTGAAKRKVKKISFATPDDEDKTGSKAAVSYEKKATSRGVKKPSVIAAKRTLKKAVKSHQDVVKYSIGKPYREFVPDARFCLSDLPWTNWKVAMAAEIPKSQPASDWCPRTNGHIGHRNWNIFYRDTKCAALYEFAVQAKTGSRKYVMYQRASEGFKRQSWDTYLMNNPRIRRQVDRVLRKGCKIFIRRAKIDKFPKKLDVGKTAVSLEGMKEVLRANYDYAWDMCGRASRRNVMRRGTLLSAPSFTA